MTTQRKKLSDILQGKSSWVGGDWSKIQAAPDYGKPIPRGKYSARLLDAEPFVAPLKGTPGVKLRFEIREGEHRGRQLSYTIWLTDAAKAGAVRDFAKLGIHSQEQLEDGVPPGILTDLFVVIRTSEAGEEYNEVRTFEVTGVEQGDAFAPP